MKEDDGFGEWLTTSLRKQFPSRLKRKGKGKKRKARKKNKFLEILERLIPSNKLFWKRVERGADVLLVLFILIAVIVKWKAVSSFLLIFFLVLASISSFLWLLYALGYFAEWLIRDFKNFKKSKEI